LLLNYFAAVVDEDKGNEVQVIASSHSPILVSQAPIDSIICVQENNDEVRAISVCTIPMDLEMKKKLQRFLDATRAELFFARRILMVEGIAEALLLPVLARIAGGDLKKSAVTVVNADGINFNCFLPLFGSGRITCPVAILTDGDADKIGGACSATAANLKAIETTIENLRVEQSEITFEHELARSPLMLPLMLDAFEALYPSVAAKLRSTISALTNEDDMADAFFSQFRISAKSKGVFAQELAALLDNADLKEAAVPQYIRSALKFLSVIGTDDDSNQSGQSATTDPAAVTNGPATGGDFCR
jgi:putative ATP-dependent endonuclease of OLD family